MADRSSARVSMTAEVPEAIPVSNLDNVLDLYMDPSAMSRTSVRRSIDRRSADRRSVASRQSADRRSVGRVSVERHSVASHSSRSSSNSRNVRSDSDLAREIQQKLNNPGYVSPEDEAAAREMERQINDPNRPGVDTYHTPQEELGDEDLANALYEQEMDELEEEAYALQERLANDDRDYMRPQNFQPWFCRVVLVVTTIVCIAEIGQNGWQIEPLGVNPTFGPSVETLVSMGAKKTDLILAGDFYRLFTPMLLHAGFLHLLFNMIGLLNVGFPAEREFGSAKIAAIYICSGVIGVLMSAIFVPQQVGVGASGAIFGLFGSAWADLIMNWSLYREQAKWVLMQLLISTIINLAIGLVPFLDNFAHTGGFLCGLIMGFTLLVQKRYDVLGFRKRARTYQICLQGLAVATVPIMFVVLMLVLYLQVDVENGCQWCGYISCVPLPPGVPDNEKWWDCTPCSQTIIELQNINVQENSYTVPCPDGTLVDVTSDMQTLGENTIADLQKDTSKILLVCKEFCLGQ